MAGSFESDANDKNMVKKDPSTNSDASSSERVPSYTVLGRLPVPIVSSCHGLLSALEEFRGDIPFSSEIIRRATVEFTDNQLVLVNDVLEAALIESNYGIDRQFYVALVALGESLETRIKDEEKFYAAQKERYSDIYGIVRQSSFPFSANQGACLYRMVAAVYQLTGHPDSETDKEFVRSLRDLVRLVQSGDHLRDPTPHRFIITHTLHYYLHEMLLKVNVLSREEDERAHPDFVHPHSEIDLASYLALQLEALVDMSKVTTPKDHFHYGMVEVYTRLVDIFRESGLDFSSRQEVILQKAERNIRVLRKEPFMSKHQAIVGAFMEFMSELEENNPDREVKLDGVKVVWAEEGKVNKAVREIVWDLVYLQPVATEHLRNFPTFGLGVENVAAKIMERFMALYPLH